MDIKNPSAVARIRIHKPALEVFNAFADPSQMSRFWFTRRDKGLRQGETVPWFIGDGGDAVSFEVFVRELSRPDKIVITWERSGVITQVAWTIEDAGNGEAILTIEETGFAGGRDAVIEQVLDSTGGFNQVVVAAKAFIEHGIEVNVVSDHV